jgi:hypothetical protein
MVVGIKLPSEYQQLHFSALPFLAELKELGEGQKITVVAWTLTRLPHSVRFVGSGKPFIHRMLRQNGLLVVGANVLSLV